MVLSDARQACGIVCSVLLLRQDEQEGTLVVFGGEDNRVEVEEKGCETPVGCFLKEGMEAWKYPDYYYSELRYTAIRNLSIQSSPQITFCCIT